MDIGSGSLHFAWFNRGMHVYAYVRYLSEQSLLFFGITVYIHYTAREAVTMFIFLLVYYTVCRDSVLHTEGGVPRDFPPRNSDFPSQVLPTLPILCNIFPPQGIRSSIYLLNNHDSVLNTEWCPRVRHIRRVWLGVEPINRIKDIRLTPFPHIRDISYKWQYWANRTVHGACSVKLSMYMYMYTHVCWV